MGYFRELPNILYPSFLPEKTSSLDFILVKNVFRRVKLRDDLYKNFVVFQKYEVPEGASCFALWWRSSICTLS